MVSNHLRIKDICHHYGNEFKTESVLSSINLDLKKGELVGLLGPSGCGKTTLLRLIAGFERPVHGSISIEDKVVATPSYLLPPERRGIGMVFQDYALFPHLDVWKNVCFGLKNNSNKSRAIWLLELLGLKELIHRYPHQLSGGQRQRLALARALAPGPSLVLLDEPFCSLDVQVRQRLRSELSLVLKSCNATALLVTHDPNEALAICDRVAVMCEGELHQCEAPSSIVENPATAFVGQFVLQRNLIPITNESNCYLTPIGPLSKPDQVNSHKVNELIVDESSLQIRTRPDGKGLILSREFFSNRWLLKVEFNNLIFRIWHQLDNPPKAGEKCDVSVRKDKNGILFPGSIKCPLL